MNPSYYLALLDGKRLTEQQFEMPAPHQRKRSARARRAWREWMARPVSRLAARAGVLITQPSSPRN